MSAARYALLKLEESPPHVKNWRPQLLLLSKCNKVNTNEKQENYTIEHANAFAFAAQLKAGKGLFVCANVLSGDFLEKTEDAKECKKLLKNTMNHFKVKGFADTLISQNVEQGLSHL